MTGIEHIAAERRRQIDSEGYEAAHDDQHANGELAEAAESYVSAAIALERGEAVDTVWQRETTYRWPWEPDCMKVDGDPIRNLEKAGALIAAEIDRLQRQEAAHACSVGQRLLVEALWQELIPTRAPVLVGVDTARVERDETGAAVQLFPSVRRAKT